ncbi:MAG: alpha/beta hydrolase [Alphaproteobacteria bacterium]|nr:alpha/beta hydrolase [Alphaproteobacteria bacterium]MDX5369609.1 alpha/beta hydrolase [Alphaproteobacteria bacterium]MDX5464260.1 alpha/beta hydrolase [Alphaproteobacteria bacterium]
MEQVLTDGPVGASATVLFAHGAGAGMDSPFMTGAARGLAAHGIRVVRFEFPYMRRARIEGRKAPPDRMPVLCDAFRGAAAGLVGARRLVVAGKSMGARVAATVAADVGAAGVLCFGYPFHPTGKPDRLRLEPLQALDCPALIVQGTRDPFGNFEEVPGYELPERVRVQWVPDGNHDLAPRKSSGTTPEVALSRALEAAARFIRFLPERTDP